MLFSTITLPIAYAAGVISFFAPCVLPLLPVYISYVTGVSLKDLKTKGYKPFRKKLLVSSVFYIIGFTLFFTILGTSAAGFGVILRRNAREIQIVGGILMIIFGLEFAGKLNLNFIQNKIFPNKFNLKLELPKWADKYDSVRSFLLGIIFAITWTPCVGAVLGSIYALAAVSGSALSGATLLFVYSLGITTPFIIVSLTLVQAPKYLKVISSKIEIINKISGFILVILGLLLLTGYYAHLNAFIFDIAFGLGYEIR